MDVIMWITSWQQVSYSLTTVGEWTPYTFTRLTNNTRKHESEHSQCDVSITAALAAGELTPTRVDHRIFLSDTKLSPRQEEWSIQTLFSPVIQITCCYIWIFKSFSSKLEPLSRRNNAINCLRTIYSQVDSHLTSSFYFNSFYTTFVRA